HPCIASRRVAPVPPSRFSLLFRVAPSPMSSTASIISRRSVRQSARASRRPSMSRCPLLSKSSISLISASHRSNSVTRLTLLGYLLERAAVTFESRLLVGLLLPAEYRHIDVLRVDVEPVANSFRLFRGDQRTARPEERVIYSVIALGVVKDRTAHQ